ncbi:hypothetical protein C9F11_42810 (plasmid) [Streptomyces sp. YIM 121038]|nr:hypothetical protein C9F11_42810 [Streptomyces sp. YIM 121038]
MAGRVEERASVTRNKPRWQPGGGGREVLWRARSARGTPSPRPPGARQRGHARNVPAAAAALPGCALDDSGVCGSQLSERVVLMRSAHSAARHAAPTSEPDEHTAARGGARQRRRAAGRTRPELNYLPTNNGRRRRPRANDQGPGSGARRAGSGERRAGPGGAAPHNPERAARRQEPGARARGRRRGAGQGGRRRLGARRTAGAAPCRRVPGARRTSRTATHRPQARPKRQVPASPGPSFGEVQRTPPQPRTPRPRTNGAHGRALPRRAGPTNSTTTCTTPQTRRRRHRRRRRAPGARRAGTRSSPAAQRRPPRTAKTRARHGQRKRGRTAGGPGEGRRTGEGGLRRRAADPRPQATGPGGGRRARGDELDEYLHQQGLRPRRGTRPRRGRHGPGRRGPARRGAARPGAAAPRRRTPAARRAAAAARHFTERARRGRRAGTATDERRARADGSATRGAA